MFPVMLVKEQMQLMKVCGGHLPMVLLVQIAQGHRICQELVEDGYAFDADLFIEGNRITQGRAVWLGLYRVLIEVRSGGSRRISAGRGARPTAICVGLCRFQ